jgi:hypothetical protein
MLLTPSIVRTAMQPFNTSHDCCCVYGCINHIHAPHTTLTDTHHTHPLHTTLLLQPHVRHHPSTAPTRAPSLFYYNRTCVTTRPPHLHVRHHSSTTSSRRFPTKSTKPHVGVVTCGQVGSVGIWPALWDEGARHLAQHLLPQGATGPCSTLVVVGHVPVA